jgi:hypothetical protein
MTVRSAAPLRQLRGASSGLHVFISNPRFLRNLQDSLRRAGCVAEQRRSHELEVYLPEAPSPEQARRELNLYLAAWQATNPGIDAYIIESSEPGEALKE